jgi:hypothetical protein
MTGCGSRHATPAAIAPAVTRPALQAKATLSPQHVAATVPASQPVATYANTSAGICLSYPANWKPEKAKTAAFAVAGPTGTTRGYSSLSLDIPKMPWHIKDMIPMMVVAHDYVSDLRQNQIPDAQVQQETDITVPGASARRITCAGHENGKTSIDVAVILIHADQVYILSADSDDAGRMAARHAIDDAVASLKWTK